MLLYSIWESFLFLILALFFSVEINTNIFHFGFLVSAIILEIFDTISAKFPKRL